MARDTGPGHLPSAEEVAQKKRDLKLAYDTWWAHQGDAEYLAYQRAKRQYNDVHARRTFGLLLRYD